MKFSLGISDFLEEISSLSPIVFLYFFALIIEEGFLFSPFYSLELCIHIGISFFFSFFFSFLLFTGICKASSDSHFAFLYFFFLGKVLLPVSCTVSGISVHSSSGTLSIRSNPLNLFSLPLYNHKGFLQSISFLLYLLKMPFILQPTPVLLPEKSHGWRSLVGCNPWGREELDTTGWLHFHFSLSCIGEENGTPLQCSCLDNPRMGEPGGLPSMGSHRVGHD